MNTYKKISLITLFCFATVMYAKDAEHQVTLKNKNGEYLKIIDNGEQGTFVKDRAEATIFLSEKVTDTSGLVGTIKNNFLSDGRYLHNDLTLKSEQPEHFWTAPVHYLYYNNFKSGDQKLIAENI